MPRKTTTPTTTPAAAETTEEGDARYTLYSRWLQTEKGVTVEPYSLQVAVRNYGAFQRSDMNKQANAASKESRATARAERDKNVSARKEAAAKKTAAREARRAEREKAATKKTPAAAKETATTKSAPSKAAAKKTAPTKATKATKAPAKKGPADLAASLPKTGGTKATRTAGKGKVSPF